MSPSRPAGEWVPRMQVGQCCRCPVLGYYGKPFQERARVVWVCPSHHSHCAHWPDLQTEGLDKAKSDRAPVTWSSSELHLTGVRGSTRKRTPAGESLCPVARPRPGPGPCAPERRGGGHQHRPRQAQHGGVLISFLCWRQRGSGHQVTSKPGAAPSHGHLEKDKPNI